ncbi:MAG: response regulator [Coleofasciculus sp. G3-WIS-01]|uniref:response regulator n=1 Tax=Coleofasciculus sp. G3-WIS-01 TaxID=3069528 RepID=UPI0032F4F765
MSKGNLLIVDDTPENLQVLSATLSDQGYQVRGVVKGKMAIRAAKSAQPDLILLDIRMPEMDGYTVCEHLKADPDTCGIPVIFISAIDDVLDKVKAFRVGGVDYITKPFQVEEVLARVEHQLTIRRLSQQLSDRNQKLEQEIQERRKAEKAAAAASKAKSEFLANMSHELRTPLNSILGFTQVMIRDLKLTPEQREYLGIINRSGEHLLDLINDVLDLSKIEAGIISLYESSFDLYRLLDNLEEMFQIKAEQKKINLVFLIAPNVPQTIKTDAKKLRVCLINLLGNAIKFTEQGTITLRVNLATEALIDQNPSDTDSSLLSAFPPRLRFEVEDTGAGISPAEIDHLFDAFVQTETGQKMAEGTGLGLTITRKFVQLMGGTITVNSVVGKGTIFRFDIKISPAEVSPVTPQSSQRVLCLETNQPIYRILVVDDTPENRLLLIKLLEPIGFEVREAVNGMEAVALWESWQPHLIFMDTRMPMMDGLEATRRLRIKEKERLSKLNSAPDFPRTIIIALTASAFEERREEILAAGSEDFFRKPFTEEQIFDTIAHYLGVRYRYEELSEGLPLPGSSYRIQEKPDSFFCSELASLPSAWVTELAQAANQLDEAMIAQLIQELPTEKADLAKALTDLLHNFRLDIIVRVSQAVINYKDESDAKSTIINSIEKR